MAAANPLMDVVETLIVGSLTHTEEFKGLSIIFFAHVLHLIKHLTENIKSVDSFILIIPGYAVDQLLNDVVSGFPQILRIYVYYDSDDDLKRGEDRIKNEDGKIRFCHTRNLKAVIQKLNIDNAIRPPGSNYDATVNDVASSWTQRLLAKRLNADAHYSSEPKRNRTNQNGSYRENNATIMDIYTQQIDPVNTTGTRVNIVSNDQQIWSLEKALHDASLTSYNGTYTWKISNVQDKIVDAQSERNKSMYSPPFYSWRRGYKICLRLYLNGDGDTRDKYISLFIVLMRNDDDDILQWPFPYPVTLCLLNQSEPNDNRMTIIHSVRPDIRSNYLKRPISNMNEAYGIKEFLSLEQFEQNQSLFVKDDTMFIGAKIDFLNQNSSIASTVGSPNDEEHVGEITENLILFS